MNYLIYSNKDQTQLVYLSENCSSAEQAVRDFKDNTGVTDEYDNEEVAIGYTDLELSGFISGAHGYLAYWQNVVDVIESI